MTFLKRLMLSSHQYFLSPAGLQPQQEQPSAATAGIPPLVRSTALTDRRYILAQDAVGRVELWDILKGTLERDFGIVVSPAGLGRLWGAGWEVQHGSQHPRPDAGAMEHARQGTLQTMWNARQGTCKTATLAHSGSRRVT